MADGKKYISVSQLGMYERCAESYRRRYLEKEIIPPGMALLKGTGVHGGAKKNFKQKIESHEDMKKSDIVESSVSKFEERMKDDGYQLSADEKTMGPGKVIGMTKDSVAKLSALYADEVAPEYQPLQVEEHQRLVLSGEYDLYVVMDLADDKGIVVELKTASKKKAAKEVDNSEQLTFYSLVYKAINGKMPKAVRLEVLVDKKNRERQMLEGTRDDADLQTLVRRINTMIAGLEAGIFMPCSRDSWTCSEKWCGFYRTCKYTKG